MVGSFAMMRFIQAWCKSTISPCLSNRFIFGEITTIMNNIRFNATVLYAIYMNTLLFPLTQEESIVQNIV